MLIHVKTIKTVMQEIHAEPTVVFKSLVEGANDRMRQTVLKNSPAFNERIVYWSTVENNKDFNLLLQLKVEGQDHDLIRIGVASVGEKDLDTNCLPVPSSTAAKCFQLLLNNTTITLSPLDFLQASFTFSAEVDVHEIVEQVDAVHRETSSGAGLIAAVKTGFGPKPIISTMKSAESCVSTTGRLRIAKRALGVKADDLFCKLVHQIYFRFQKQAVIDARIKDVRAKHV